MLIRKLVFLFIILLLIESIVSIAISRSLPEFWGNPTIFSKLVYLENHPEINTVFVGSSKIENQVNISIFDSCTDHRTTSFNLGCQGLMIPESYKLLDHLLDNKNLKYLLLECRSTYHIKPRNLHITRTVYYENMSLFKMTILSTWYSGLPAIRKMMIMTTHTISFIESLLNFSFIQGLIDFKKNEQNISKQEHYNITKGFDQPDTITFDELKKNPELMADRKEQSILYKHKMDSDQFGNELNQYHLNELQGFADKAERNHIKLIFMIPSSMREFEYKEMLPVLRNLKNPKELLMFDANRFPELYEVKNNLEPEHLNYYGSIYFSKYLGQEFSRIIYN